MSLPAGSLTAIAGPSGAGKSSLLLCLLGRLPVRAGEVRVLGRPPARASRLLGYLPQQDLVDWRFPLTVAEAVMLGRYGRLGRFRRPSSRDRALLSACLAEVGLDRQAEWPVAELNVGQRRRALLARALVREPEVLLLDEPFQGLNPPTADELSALVRRLRQRGMTVLVATRDLDRAAERFERVILLSGQVVAEGPPSEIFTVTNLRAAYGSQVVPLNVGPEYFAVHAGPHQR